MTKIAILHDESSFLHDESSFSSLTPFQPQADNGSYGSLVDETKERGFEVFLSPPEAYQENGLINGFWRRESGFWKLEMKQERVDGVFVRYAPKPELEYIRDDLEEKNIPHVNPYFIDDVAKADKYFTYTVFPDLLPPTVKFQPGDYFSRKILDLEDLVNKSPGKEDLSMDKVFCKPACGHGGEGIKVYEKGVEEIHVNEDYVLQPFVETRTGIPELDIRGRHDLRIAMFDGEPFYSYVRQPRGEGLLSNRAQGGKTQYIDISAIRESAPEFLEISERVDEELRKVGHRFYSVDMMRGESGRVWVVELNSQTGIVWHPEDMVDVSERFKLHKRLAEWLVESLK